jgi:glycogen(starch) synthase
VKLLIYSHFFAPSVGGVETSVEALARGLATYNAAPGSTPFEIVLVTNTAPGAFDDSNFSFPVVRNPGLRELVRLVRMADVLHIAGPALLPLMLARIFGKPAVVEHHGYQAICLNGGLLHEPDRAVCPGHFQAGHLAECFRCRRSELSSATGSLRSVLLTKIRNRLCQNAENIAISEHVRKRHALPNSSVIYYGIQDILVNNPAKPQERHSPPKFSFAYVGRLSPEKGLGVLLQAAAQLQRNLHEFEVLLVGDGPERQNLELNIQKLGLKSCVRVTGFLRGGQLLSLLEDVQVVVMPSICEETAGLSAMEHMMRGRVVIASAIGGLGEVVDSTGILVPPGDPEALAAAMQDILADPERIAAIGKKARARALSTFGYVRMLQEHVAVYRRVASHSRSMAR